MSSRHVVTPPSMPPLAHYSPAIVSGGVVYCSGILGTDESGELVVGGSYEQTRRALANLEVVLGDAGSSLAHLLRVTCFLDQDGKFAEFERAYLELVPSPPPARLTVAVHLVVDSALVEIEATAGLAGARP